MTEEQKIKTVAIIGNPNSGKTTVFNLLTGGHQRVGNWPGVTVEKKEGAVRLSGGAINLVDLPGIYSVSASSEDERVSRDYLLSGEADLVIDIIDATNLERNLYLTTQLIEMGTPVFVILTMMDLAKENHLVIEVPHLAKHLDLPVAAVDATNPKSLPYIREALEAALARLQKSSLVVSYTNEIEDAIGAVEVCLGEAARTMNVTRRYAALKVLEGDPLFVLYANEFGNLPQEKIAEQNKKIETVLKEEADMAIADSRYGFIRGIALDVVKKTAEKIPISDKIDKIALHRVFGIPLFLAAMYLVFWITMNVGGAFIDFFDILFGTIFVQGLGELLQSFGTPDWLVAGLAGGLGTGIQTISTFIPIIFTLFLALSMLEDSGYMARAAFVMDRFMRLIGLPGKAFVPLIVGFGCTVPAIMGTRTLENRRDRVMTIFMSPFMSCGARLPVYALFAAAFFPAAAGMVVFSLYIVGIAFAVLTGILLKTTVFQGEASHFIMELPPYHKPRMRHIMIHTWLRLKVFMFRAGKVIVMMVLILGILNSMSVGENGVSFGNEDSEESLLSVIGKTLTPVFSPLGIKEENWPATVGVFTGLLAKESVVGTLSSLYGQRAALAEAHDSKGDSGEFSLLDGITEAFLSISRNLADLGASFLDPLGFRAVSGDEESAAEEAGMDTDVFERLRRSFSPAAAYAYLIFILLYFPCVAAQGAAIRELGRKMGMFLAAYLTTFAWVAAVLVFQIAEGGSALWIILCAGIAAAVIGFFALFGKRVFGVMG
ncbi:MAG: Fe(2+) transporter permease subunit FeoB [Spirochaetales bacterium]|jgi:ferrous iron transport protein B|nr:Fe(2+) transporter permease subunit FeoB [Spirochaetales bacterium]